MLERLWSWLTTRLLDDADIGCYKNHVVVDTDCNKHEIAETLDLPAYKDPVDELHTLPDDENRIYVWQVETEREKEQVLRWFEQAKADPQALHFVLSELEELREYDEQELKPYLGGFD
jgi:hypothetical protein